MSWKVTVSKKAGKNLQTLPTKIRALFGTLVVDLATSGPYQPSWPNYKKLADGRLHAHLNYSYVAVWIIVDPVAKEIEVKYVGSREDAPY